MSDLAAARVQMGMSLAFHIVFAVVGIAMPVLMVAAERRWRRSGDPIHLDLARRWARGTAILFAVGAVSGTVAAAAQVSLILWGWAGSQYPYVIPRDLTIADAAAPGATLRLVLIALALGAAVLVPSLVYLFRIFKLGDPASAVRHQ